MNEKDLVGMSIERLLNLQKLNITLLEHYIVRDDVYTKNDLLDAIKTVYIINSTIRFKIKKK